MNLFRPLKGAKTLLVDDDEQIRNSLNMIFATKSCFIKTAETAEEGLRALEEEIFDSIISDLRLPDIDRLRFLRFAAPIQPEPVKLPFTAYKDDHVFDEAERIGANQFIEKPFSLKSLTDLLAISLRPQTINKLSRGN